MSPHEQTLYDRLVAVFGKAGRAVVDAIRNGEPPNLQALDAALRTALTVHLQDTMLATMTDLAETIGVDFDTAVQGTAASEWAARHAGERMQGISDTTRASVQDATSRYLSTPGMTRDDLVGLLKPTFGASRAEVVATTETTAAAANGARTYQGYLADNGIGMERVNNTNADDSVCEICGPLNDKPESAWPDDGGPPWHPRCRCQVLLRSVPV